MRAINMPSEKLSDFACIFGNANRSDRENLQSVIQNRRKFQPFIL